MADEQKPTTPVIPDAPASGTAASGAPGTTPEAPKEGTATSQTPNTPVETTPEAAVKVVQDAGLDMNALSEEYAKNGKLSEASVAKLSEKGITQAHIDAYAQGLQAQATKLWSTVGEAVGGEETAKTILSWAATNLSEGDRAAYNKAVTSGDTAAATLLMRGIASQYLAQMGSEGEVLNGEAKASMTGIVPFKSNQEVVAAMSDKRYSTDPAYRAKVEKRLSIS